MQLSDILVLLQTIGVILAILVSFGTIKGKSDSKVINMTKIETDLDYIKKAVECIPTQNLQIVGIGKDLEALARRFDDHLTAHYKKEENP